MLLYDTINVFEGIYVYGDLTSHGYTTSCFKYFLDKNFRCHPKVQNSCHDSMMKAMSFKKVIILSVNSVSYREHFICMNKNEVGNRLQIANFIKKIWMIKS